MGTASHRRDIKILEGNSGAVVRSGDLCRAYAREPPAASISYVVIRIFAPNGPPCGLTVEIDTCLTFLPTTMNIAI